jgi:hypothetical protein
LVRVVSSSSAGTAVVSASVSRDEGGGLVVPVRFFVLGTPGTFPQRVDDEQQHSDDAGADAHPRNQLVAGHDSRDEGGQPDDGED